MPAHYRPAFFFPRLSNVSGDRDHYVMVRHKVMFFSISLVTFFKFSSVVLKNLLYSPSNNIVIDSGMRLAFFIFLTLLVAGAIFGVISFIIDLLRQIFEGAGYYGFITVVGILVLIVSIVSIAKG